MSPPDPVRSLLEHGDIEVEGRMPWSSNATFLVTVRCDGAWMRAVYKPHRGERPLWDFPSGLWMREAAAFELSEALGWGLIPHTVTRDGPYGEGSLQRFVDADFEQHYFTIYEAGRHHDRLRAMCAFDLLANNTDRKAGHCLLSIGDEVLGIDNGLCFHVDFKLRTVIWEYGGEPIPDRLIADMSVLCDAGPPPPLQRLLTGAEVDALVRRADALVSSGTFPIDHGGHRYPWPLV